MPVNELFNFCCSFRTLLFARFFFSPALRSNIECKLKRKTKI